MQWKGARMKFKNFISAGNEKCSFKSYVAAPYFRKTFQLEDSISSGELLICGLGFYRLFINGIEITKGALAPYISNTDDLVYYDRYDITQSVQIGKNVIGVILGNGMQNAFGGYTWDFDKADFQSEPKLSLSIKCTLNSGAEVLLESDDTFKTHKSPIFFNDLWCGEFYDANQEIDGWSQIDYIDDAWVNAHKTSTPKGEQRICEAIPILCTDQLQPVSITKQEAGYLYDFGINTAGVCQLKIHGKKGQTISLEHGEFLTDGKLDLKNIMYIPEGYIQKDIYICKGEETECYTPSFTYHGFRYVYVTGITKEQAIPELLTYLVMHANLRERGSFNCSDPIVNKLQEMTRRSTLANFYHFPTDCPQREKNGWTGDAQLSAEHTIINLEPDISWMEWLRNIRKTQDENGRLPGIVPTGGWGMGLGGPAWDAVVINLPYYLYVYRGNIDVLIENKTAIWRYINYLRCSRNKNGLIEIGLGDWCPAGHESDDFKAPVAVTDTALAVDLCSKAAAIFAALHMKAEEEYARKLSGEIRESARTCLIDYKNLTVAGNCQTSQSVFIYYKIFNRNEENTAVAVLLDLIHREKDHIDTGIIGGRVIFHVLAEHGYGDLAYHMITRPDFPSYGNWIARGATSLWERFFQEDCTEVSLNHHMWGDISNWFIKWLAGIHLNPNCNNIQEVEIRPIFPKQLQSATGWHESPSGKIEVNWFKTDDMAEVQIEIPEDMSGTFIYKEIRKPLNTGINRLIIQL